MQTKKVPESQIKDLPRDGYLVIREFCNQREKLTNFCGNRRQYPSRNALDLSDQSGGKKRIFPFGSRPETMYSVT